METKTTLVRTESRVELHSEASVDLTDPVIILPDDTELNDALGNGRNRQSLAVFRMLFEKAGPLKGRGKLWNSINQQLPLEKQCGEARIPLYACWNSGSEGRLDIAANVLKGEDSIQM
jgi:hypothetical protein